MPGTVCIRNADWVVAWDAASRRHAYLRGGDVAFSGNTITFVGQGYAGAADEPTSRYSSKVLAEKARLQQVRMRARTLASNA